MYGDLGHGFLLFCLGVYLLATANRAESRNPGAMGVRACRSPCMNE